MSKKNKIKMTKVKKTQVGKHHSITKLSQNLPMGAFARDYSTDDNRERVINSILKVSEESRTGDQWWQLGEYQVIKGLNTGDDSLINAGQKALLSGTKLNPPHPACLLDLGWLLCHKGLDSMAMEFLDQAAEQVPELRDVWSLRG